MALSKRGISHLEYVSVFLAELFGTALLVFLSCSSCIKWMPDGQLDSLQICLSCGFAVLISVQIFGCVSGAHINPCVTVAAAIYNIISVQMAVLYVIAQFIGAFMGYGLLTVLTPTIILQSSGPSFCVTQPGELVTIPQALCVEFIATGTLIWLCCAIWDPRSKNSQDSVSIRFALALAGLVSASAKFTGGSLNPARSTAPALWTGDFESLWVYFLGPLSGAAIAAITYKYVFRREIIEAENCGRHLDNLCDAADKA